MRLDVDAWDPGYGTGLDTGGAADRSTAQLDTDVETPAAAWRPIGPPAGVSGPAVVLLVDGVRRLDARVWITDDDGTTHGGMAASYAAGVVRCDLRRGLAEVAVSRTERGLFTSSPEAGDVTAGVVRYPAVRVGRDEPMDLLLAVQRQLRQLEITVAGEARSWSADDDDLLVVDGPLQGRAHLPRAMGYVKSHKVEYLPPELTGVVSGLRPGERCPVFGLGTSWHRYAWYLRLPGPAGSPWAGIVRAECSADITVAEAVALADRSLVTLPRFASTAYKDPRAPQNLVPIAGLERRLRATLGDARLLHRSLSLAARRTRAGETARSG
ncbi:MAG TPA: hypothetical protein VK453_18375 [Micromonosporaceae bacterium]|nr:hypothetical protein [Micromonosporaceae bacterium]